MSAPRTTPGQKLALALLGLALLVVAVALVEGALALAGWGDPAPYRDPFVGFVPGSDLFERQGTGASAQFRTRPAKLAFFNDQTFAAEKPRNGYRVFVVGGSTVAGRPYDAALAFPAWLDRYLIARDPSRAWEVINAGAISYASYRIAVLMEELARYQPDLFVIYTGHNEFLEERTYSEVARPAAWQVAAERSLGRLRSWRLARQAVDDWRSTDTEPTVPTTVTGTLSEEVTTRLGGWAGLDRYHRDPTLETSVVDHFDFNLRRMVSLARQAGAEVVVVSPVANLADFSPFKSEHGPDVTLPDRQRVATLVADGTALLDAGDAASAQAQLEAARALDPLWAAAHFHLGRAHQATGDFAAARVSLVQAKDLDVAPLRALTAIENRITSVAQSLDVPLVDLRGALEADSRARFGHDLLGGAYLLDHVHPDTPVHQRLAVMLADWLTSQGIAQTSDQWSDERRRAIDQSVLDGLDPAYYAQRDLNLGKVLGWAGKLTEAEAPLRRAAEVLGDDPELQLNVGILLLKTGRTAEARDALEQAVELDPSTAEGWFNLGVARGREGDLDGGIQALRRSITLRPDFAEAHHDLGALLFRDEQIDAAAEAFQRSLAIDPGAVPARMGLALAYRRLGRVDEARALFETVLASAPATADAHYNLGVMHAEAGQRQAAEDAYVQAIAADPGHAGARTNLGILLASTGRLEAARTQLEAAVAARPNAADAHLNLGVVRDQLGDGEGALDAVARAVALAPGNGRARLALAMLYLARGNMAAAREHATAAEAAGQALPPALAERR